MRIIAVSLLFLFFSFLAVESASVLWQVDDSVSMALIQKEQEDAQEEESKDLNQVFQSVNTQICDFDVTCSKKHTFDISDDQLADEVNQLVPYSPPEMIIG